MLTVRHIGPGSAFKVVAAAYAVIGLVVGIIFALISMLGRALMPSAEAGIFRVFFGVGAIIFLPICYGILGGILGALGAFIYNLVAGWIGGLEVDIS
jgi:hypothetical protein